MSHPLEDAKTRVDRATEHAEALYGEMLAFFRREPEPVVAEYDDDDRPFPVCTEPLPDRWSVLAGECLQALRSSLDYIAWEVALLRADAPDRFISFPIRREVDHLDGWFKGHPTATEQLGPDAVNTMRNLHLDCRAQAGDIESDPLWALNELARVDRHQALSLTVVQKHGTGGFFGQVPQVGNVLSLQVRGFRQFGTRQVQGDRRYPTATIQGNVGGEVEQYGHVGFVVAYGPGVPQGEGFNVLESLQALEHAIRTFIGPAMELLFRQPIGGVKIPFEPWPVRRTWQPPDTDPF